MKQKLLFNIIKLLILPIAIIIAIDVLISTQSGLTLTYKVASKLILGQLEIEKLQGSLIGPISIDNLHYKDTDIEINLNHLDVTWTAGALLKSKIVINQLTIDGLILHVLDSNSNDDTDYVTNTIKTLTFLTQHLFISEASIKNVVIEPYNLNLQANGELDSELHFHWQLTSSRLKAAGFTTTLAGQGELLGARTLPDLNAQFTTGQLQANNYAISPLNVNLNLDSQNQQFNLKLAPGKFYYTIDQQKRILAWQSANLQAQFQARGLNLSANWLFADQQINAQLFLPGYNKLAIPSKTQPLTGFIKIAMQRITLLAIEFPQLKNLQAKLQSTLQISGTLTKPLLAGNLHLQNGSFDIPDLNVPVRNLAINASTTPNNLINWNGSALLTGGTLQFNGTTDLKNNFNSNIVLRGNNLTVANTRAYQVNTSPDLTIKYNGQRLDIAGKVDVPKALIDLGSNQNQYVELSKDAVFVTEQNKQQTANLLPTYTHVQIALGDNIQLIYQGLKTKLNGNLTIDDSPTQPTKASGQINLVKGTYNYYGQQLDIQSGSRVTYNDSAIGNPTLDIRAVRTVTALPQSNQANPTAPTVTQQALQAQFNQPISVVVGVLVQGSAQDPQISLFADPAVLAQQDILSYVLTGQPSDQLGNASKQLLLTALASMGPGNGKLTQVMDNFQKVIGLDELTIQSGAVGSSGSLGSQASLQQNTSLVLGKKLSPKFYVNYSVGLIQPINTLQLRYLINKYFSLQATANSSSGSSSSSATPASGIDLLYTIEK